MYEDNHSPNEQNPSYTGQPGYSATNSSAQQPGQASDGSSAYSQYASQVSTYSQNPAPDPAAVNTNRNYSQYASQASGYTQNSSQTSGYTQNASQGATAYSQNSSAAYGAGAASQTASAYTQNTAQASGYTQSTPQNTSAPKHEAPRHSRFGKVMMAVCMGLLFGLFAGAGFIAVVHFAGPIQSGSAQVQDVSTSEKDTLTFNEPAVTSLNDASDETVVRVLTTEESDITDVVTKVMPSMVSITEYFTYTGNYWGQVYSEDTEASGSGIIIGETDDEYIIVTNYHVIEEADDMVVTFINNEDATAHLKGTDPSKDIAVISVLKDDLDDETISAISVAELGDSEGLVLGQNVIAIGNALGYGQSVTTGIVSALDREITMPDGSTGFFIQTDAAINPGNSGGALLNIAGQVIGINSNKIGGSSIEGMGYAIPISSVRHIIENLMERDTLIAVDEEDSGYIGIYMQEVTEEISKYYSLPQGIYVTEVVKDGGAYNAGIKAGDIIVGFDGYSVKTNDGLKKLLKYYAIGDSVDVTFMRNEDGTYEEHTVTVTLGEKPR